jgi:hypothetical protein
MILPAPLPFAVVTSPRLPARQLSQKGPGKLAVEDRSPQANPSYSKSRNADGQCNVHDGPPRGSSALSGGNFRGRFESFGATAAPTESFDTLSGTLYA